MRVETLLKRLKREFIKVNLLPGMSRYLDVFPLWSICVLFLFSLRITGHLPNIQALVGLSTVFFLTDLAYRARTYQLELYEQKKS